MTGLRTNARKTSVQILILVQFCCAVSERASMPISPSAAVGEGQLLSFKTKTSYRDLKNQIPQD